MSRVGVVVVVVVGRLWYGDGRLINQRKVSLMTLARKSIYLLLVIIVLDLPCAKKTKAMAGFEPQTS